MRTEYSHPAPYSPSQDYMKDKKKADKHLKDITNGKWHAGQAQHMGGVASLSEHLEKKHYGECCEVKKCLRHCLEMMYFYAQTSHDIYKVFAEDCFMKAKEMVKHIDEVEDKEHAEHYLDMIKDYMSDQGMSPSSMPMSNGHNMKKSGTVNL